MCRGEVKLAWGDLDRGTEPMDSSVLIYVLGLWVVSLRRRAIRKGSAATRGAQQ